MMNYTGLFANLNDYLDGLTKDQQGLIYNAMYEYVYYGTQTIIKRPASDNLRELLLYRAWLKIRKYFIEQELPDIDSKINKCIQQELIESIKKLGESETDNEQVRI